jgi:YD repeat-containing protein
MMTEHSSANTSPDPSGNRPPALTYDDAGRVASRTEYQPGSSKPKSISHYEYDELGRIVHEKHTFFDPPQPASAP